jgi:hypothetical protein
MDDHDAVSYRGVITLERAMPIERPHDAPLGMPSPEALQMATEAIRRRYVLPETMQHLVVRSECMRLAYLIQAYGLATTHRQDQIGTGKITWEWRSRWTGSRRLARAWHDRLG